MNRVNDMLSTTKSSSSGFTRNYNPEETFANVDGIPLHHKELSNYQQENEDLLKKRMGQKYVEFESPVTQKVAEQMSLTFQEAAQKA